MKLTNKKLYNKLDKLFNKIGLKYIILQDKKIENNIFYRGYIYIINWQLMSDNQLKYVNDIIYPLLIENDYEHLFYMSSKEFTIDDIKKHFPIIEYIEE